MKKLCVMLGVLVVLIPTILFTVGASADDHGGYYRQQHSPFSCAITVPDNPLTATGLATPYILSGNGCAESNPDYSAFVQATIVAPNGTVSVYSPLVTTQNYPAATPPIVPTITPGSTVGIFFGFNGLFLHLVGDGARDGNCVNGAFRSDFGQFAYCNAPALYTAMDAAVAAKTLTVPPLGMTALGAVCPTVDSFQIVDQDPADNVQTTYLTGNGYTAQNTAANRAMYPQATVLGNPSDNALLTNYVDPALGCHPWLVPDLADLGATVPSMALDQFQATTLQAGPVANVELADEMTLTNNGHESLIKTNLYRAGVDQPPVSYTAPGDDHYWCTNLATVGSAFLQANAALLQAAASPAPGDSSLYTFLAGRFVGTYENDLPAPGTVPTCDTSAGIPDPVSIVSEVVGATVTVP